VIVHNRKSFIEPVLINENGSALIRCSCSYLLELCQDLRPREAGVLLQARQRRDDTANWWFEDTPAVRRILEIEESA
jgi:hypothetical protein